jgi:rod shape determining protein RodA
VSRPLWVLVPVLITILPTILVLMQPNLGTSLMLILAGATVMFAAGVSLWYFAAVGVLGIGTVAAVFLTRGTPWQLPARLPVQPDRHLPDPSADPLGAGYNIIQAKIALGSGGWSGKGFMQGTQSG